MSEEDPRERMAKLCGAALEIRAREKLDEVVSTKQLVSVLQVLRPDNLRKSVEMDLEYQKKDLRKDFPGFFEYLVEQAEKHEEVFKTSRLARTPKDHSKEHKGSDNPDNSVRSMGKNEQFCENPVCP